jgi:hypothetical protein
MELGEILRRYAAQNDNGAAATGCVLADLEGRFFAATRLRMTTVPPPRVVCSLI